ncbi:MAG: YchF/TatD family DNA exonuclease [Ignavibacteriaceae bacterium]|jgi:TatD DNase family protein|nr:YchF/TatD family DNA exonuclease [Ignavibacteriaceae bacterium]
MFTDTHAHLFYPNYKDDLPEVIGRAQENGVEYIIVPATDLASAVQAIELAETYSMIYATIGFHPHDTKEWKDEFVEKIEELTKHPKVIGIGEIGLDYYYDFSPKDLQVRAFRAQLDLAARLGLPTIIHSRESDLDILNIVREYNEKNLRAQFHCYSSSKSHARELINLGHMISFTGNITFAKADSIRDVVKSISPENIMLETDSPFMTPKPHRGKRNEPANVRIIAEQLAQIYNMNVEDIGRITSANVHKFYGIGKKADLSYTYKIGKALYVNVTNRCNADCEFCDRKDHAIIAGYNLKMEKFQEPPDSVYIKDIGDPKRYSEIVFCGYGEPTIRWDLVRSVGKYVKENGGTTRMNTNGHGNVINNRDITKELFGVIDTVSISLNSTDPGEYSKIMKLDQKYFYEMIDFSRKAKEAGIHVVLSVVSLEEVDIEKARKFTEDEIGVEFRVRQYF